MPYVKTMNTAAQTVETKLTAEAFDMLCLGVSMCRASLSGCTNSEAGREADHLRRALAELVQAKLARKNPRLECKRSLLIVGATDVLIRRSAKVANDTIGVGTEIEFRGNMGATAWRAIILAIVNDGSRFICKFQNGDLCKAPMPMALLQTSQFRVVLAGRS